MEILKKIYNWMTHSILLFVLQLYTLICVVLYFYYGIPYKSGAFIFIILMITPGLLPILFSTVIFDFMKWRLPFNYSWIFPFTFIPTALFIGGMTWCTWFTEPQRYFYEFIHGCQAFLPF